ASAALVVGSVRFSCIALAMNPPHCVTRWCFLASLAKILGVSSVFASWWYLFTLRNTKNPWVAVASHVRHFASNPKARIPGGSRRLMPGSVPCNSWLEQKSRRERSGCETDCHEARCGEVL